jgi:urease accessory protein
MFKMRAALVSAATLALMSPAAAHTGIGHIDGFLAGFAHPLMGLDHVLAMVAVGLWAGLIGGRAMWAWPLAFVVFMASSGIAAMAGFKLPMVETGIALSVLVLGAIIALRTTAPVIIGALACALFAVFHGYAHGAELPGSVGAIAYAIGFVMATALLHALGLGAAVLVARKLTPVLTRLAGGGVALAGIALLVG